MNEVMHQAEAYLKGMWHRRWIGLGVAWIVAAAGVLYIYNTPDRYEASARLYVDTETLLRPVLAGLAIAPNVDQQVTLISRTLLSRPNIDKLMTMAGLDKGIKTNLQREEVASWLSSSIKLTAVGAAENARAPNNLFLITFQDPDPERARRVVDSLIKIFMDPAQGDRSNEAKAAVKFIDDQIKQYEASLRAAEERMKDFKIKHKYLGVTGREGSDYFSRLSQLQMEMQTAKVELGSAQRSRDAYRQELAGVAPQTTDSNAMDELTETETRLAGLRRTLDEQTRKYTDSHPDVIATRRQIQQLEAQRQTDLGSVRKAMAAGKGISGTSRSVVLQQVRISLADSEAQLAAAQAKLNGLEAQYAALQSQAQQVPEVENEYAQLNRDYDVLKRTHQSLIARREATGMGIESQGSGGAQFRIVDPPRVSPYPLKPTRLTITGLTVLAAIGAGLLASFAASWLMPVFHNARSLRELTQRPILGMVSMLPSEALARYHRRDAIMLFAGIAGMFAIFLAVVIVLRIVEPAA
jgi:polysaccharide chain length determinant protein (PEP-CTERM system associated)